MTATDTSSETVSIRELLASGQTYVGVPSGNSMWPMLRGKRDLVVVQGITAETHLKKGDVALFVNPTHTSKEPRKGITNPRPTNPHSATPRSADPQPTSAPHEAAPAPDHLVLHRVARVTPEGYLFWGDNCLHSDGIIPPEHVIGILTAYTKDGREKHLDSPCYTCYVAVWTLLRPGRTLWKRCRPVAGRLKRRLARLFR